VAFISYRFCLCAGFVLSLFAFHYSPWLWPVFESHFCHLSLKSKSADLSPGHLDILFFMSLGLDLLLVHGHLVVPTGRLMDHWLWISRVHPFEWFFTGDGMDLVMDGSAKLSVFWMTDTGLVNLD